MQKFETPQISINEFEVEDVVTVSNGEPTTTPAPLPTLGPNDFPAIS